MATLNEISQHLGNAHQALDSTRTATLGEIDMAAAVRDHILGDIESFRSAMTDIIKQMQENLDSYCGGLQAVVRQEFDEHDKAMRAIVAAPPKQQEQQGQQQGQEQKKDEAA